MQPALQRKTYSVLGHAATCRMRLLSGVCPGESLPGSRRAVGSPGPTSSSHWPSNSHTTPTAADAPQPPSSDAAPRSLQTLVGGCALRREAQQNKISQGSAAGWLSNIRPPEIYRINMQRCSTEVASSFQTCVAQRIVCGWPHVLLTRVTVEAHFQAEENGQQDQRCGRCGP